MVMMLTEAQRDELEQRVRAVESGPLQASSVTIDERDEPDGGYVQVSVRIDEENLNGADFLDFRTQVRSAVSSVLGSAEFQLTYVPLMEQAAEADESDDEAALDVEGEER